MQKQPLRILAIGAHPDDCEISAGGTAALFVQAGHTVKFVSMTNGDTGHHIIGGGQLARRRHAEAMAAAAVIGIDYDVMDIHNGELEANLYYRKSVIRLIRAFEPDLVLTHPPDDYHPDHRYTSILVQDSAYVVTVPGMCPLSPHLTVNPVYAYMIGAPTRSSSFEPDILVDIESVFDRKLDMIRCHESQLFEWLPYNQGRLDEVPDGSAERRAWLDEQFRNRIAAIADHWREPLVRDFGQERGEQIRYVEAIQACPFGSPLDRAAVQRLFGSLEVSGAVAIPSGGA